MKVNVCEMDSCDEEVDEFRWDSSCSMFDEKQTMEIVFELSTICGIILNDWEDAI